MPRTYFDAVINKDYHPIFNGTPEEVKKWLSERLDDEEVQESQVCLGTTLTFTSIENYLK
jgi:hypothetical protein